MIEAKVALNRARFFRWLAQRNGETADRVVAPDPEWALPDPEQAVIAEPAWWAPEPPKSGKPTPPEKGKGYASWA